MELVNVYFEVAHEELVEKCIHDAKFQFINLDFFDDRSADLTSQVLPQKVSYRDVELLEGMITVSMKRHYKRYGKYVLHYSYVEYEALAFPSLDAG